MNVKMTGMELSRCIGKVLICAVVFLSGCTTKVAYESLQHNGRLSCEGLPLSEYDECMTQYEESYESYSRSRDLLIKASQND